MESQPEGHSKTEDSNRAFTASGPVAVAVIVVTFQNEADIDPLVQSLRGEVDDQSLRVIISDNSSSDRTVHAARRHSDVVVVETGGNYGYSGAINRAMAFVGEAEAILILNPDLTVGPGAIAHLVARLSRAGTEGIVVPAIENPDGSIALSLRYEPTLSRRLGDAVFGSKWPTRPSALSETVRNRRLYLSPHRIEWATGAALLVSRTVSDRLGSWDERFFLYSEETDYFRRARDLGVQIWFEPAARVTHKEAGSGRSAQLVALTVVNAVRYIEKHQPRSAAAHRAILALHELRRWRDPEHRVARTILLDRAGWDSLPAATKGSRS